MQRRQPLAGRTLLGSTLGNASGPLQQMRGGSALLPTMIKMGALRSIVTRAASSFLLEISTVDNCSYPCGRLSGLVSRSRSLRGSTLPTAPPETTSGNEKVADSKSADVTKPNTAVLQFVSQGLHQKPKHAKRAADFAQLHEDRDKKTYHGLSFAATPDAVIRLLERTPTQRSGPMVPNALFGVMQRTPRVDVIVLSGESGGGKTVSAMKAACDTGVTFYALGRELELEDLEIELEQQLQEAAAKDHKAMIA